MTNVHNEPQSVETLRLPGLSCPMPVLRAKKALAKMTPDLSDFCRQTGHGLLKQEEVDDDGRHWFVSEIQRRAD